ncbi:MAG: tetratricopeptide repeat protein [Candidatus Omnitrophica bacterium]|nr:tetratricopeptide repeat protein [Candidatus Omnitrophota bacterium]
MLAMTFLAYLPAMAGGYIWDDDVHVTHNPTLKSLAGLEKIWMDPTILPQYYPLVFTSFWIEYRLWQLQPLGYHVVNVALHALNAILLWLVLRRLRVPGAWLAGAVFALHPVHVESVAWIAERKNVLSGALYLSALLSYLRFVDVDAGSDRLLSREGPRPWRIYALAFSLYLGALLSKTVTCTLPAALLLILWWKRGRLGRSEILPVVPMLLVGAAMGLMTAWLEKHRAGAQGPEWALSAVERCLIAGRAVWFYAGKLVWPRSLMFIYPRWRLEPASLFQWLYPAAAVALVLALWALRKQIGRAPPAAALFFAGTLAPALGFFDVYPMRYSFVADHFQYLASMGPIALFGAGVSSLLRRLHAPMRLIGSLATTALLAALGGLTWRQGTMYRDPETLWRHTLRRNPSGWMAHHNLGSVLLEQHKLDEARAEFLETLRLKPDYGVAHNNLGIILYQEGKFPEAMAEYRRALQLQPDYAVASYNLGRLLADQGKFSEAVTQYTEALRLQPDFPEALNGCGVALALAGKLSEALALFAEALRLEPDYAEAHSNAGLALALQGKPEAAIRHYTEAIRLKPDYAEAHYNLGRALAAQGKLEEAISRYTQALRLAPDHPVAHNSLGLALAQQGNLVDAIRHYTEALRLQPNFLDARRNLEEALVEQRTTKESPP